MSDYSQFAQANPGTDYPVKDALLRAQLSLDSDKVDSAAIGYAFGYKRNTTAGLNVGHYGGVISVAGVKTIIADGTVALTDATTNYVERTTAGVVSKNTVGYTAGKIPMFRAVTAGGIVTGVTDDRQSNVFGDMLLAGVFATVGGADADGDLWYRAASVLTRLAKGAANTGLFMNAAGTAPEWGATTKVGTFTRVANAANGNVAYTGLGFKPSAILFFSAYTGAFWCLSFTSASVKRGLLSIAGAMYQSTDAVNMSDGGVETETGVLYSLDADGFTLTWTKTAGMPAWTVDINYVAFR